MHRLQPLLSVAFTTLVTSRYTLLTTISCVGSVAQSVEECAVDSEGVSSNPLQRSFQFFSCFLLTVTFRRFVKIHQFMSHNIMHYYHDKITHLLFVSPFLHIASGPLNLKTLHKGLVHLGARFFVWHLENGLLICFKEIHQV